MRYIMNHRQSLLTIAWFLTAMLLGGSLLNALPIAGDFGVCAEERVLEVDDDRSDAFEVDLALHNQIDLHPTSQTWQALQVFYCDHTIAAIPSANLQRGPPSL